MSKENLNEEMNTELQVTEGAEVEPEKVGLIAKVGNFIGRNKKKLIGGAVLVAAGGLLVKLMKAATAGADEFDECDDDLEVIDLDDDTTTK